ncbi:MAG TPA: SurA N-terminal domain-containing protein [Acidobacteriaceae bacterium]|nr:SurA N-terminal domain-containing protein [Acidobacteriaceae bacterium]
MTGKEREGLSVDGMVKIFSRMQHMDASVASRRAGFRLPELKPSRIVLGALLLTLMAGCNRTPNPDVWATVNGHPIQRADVEKYYQNSLNPSQPAPTEDEASRLRLEILRGLIDDEITRQQAEKLHLVATDAEVDAKIAEMKAPYTEAQFNAQLKAKNLTIDDLRRDLSRSLTRNKVLNKEIESKINITDADIASYYNSHQSEYNLIEPEYHLAQIIVTDVPNQQPGNLQNNKAKNDAEAKKKIQALHNRLESGDDFATLAMNYSEDPNTNSSGGDAGFVSESQLRADPQIYNAISPLKPGEITPILPLYSPSKQIMGYRIYKLIDLEPAGQHLLTDPRVQQMIRQQLHDSRSRLMKEAYLEVMQDHSHVVNYYAEQLLKNVH